MTNSRTETIWRDGRLGDRRRIELSSGPVEYHDIGSGPVVVFVHGYLVNANIWRRLVPLLADDVRCITPDWPLGSHVLPMRADADLSPLGIGDLIAEFIDATGLDDVTLVGNDSGGAYSQIAASRHRRRISRLVLNSCETPWCSWPPDPGGFGLLRYAARHRATHRLLYQPLRLPLTWRWRNTYGWLAKHPIDQQAMRSYVDPVIHDAAIRCDGRKAIGSVSASYTRDAATALSQCDDLDIVLAWGADDHVFPLAHARRYADALGAPLVTIADSYTYTAEDQPERTAQVLLDHLTSR